VHAAKTKTDLYAVKILDKPLKVDIAKLKFDRKTMGMVFKADQRKVANALEAVAESWADWEKLVAEFEASGKVTVDGYEVAKEMVTWEKKVRQRSECEGGALLRRRKDIVSFEKGVSFYGSGQLRSGFVGGDPPEPPLRPARSHVLERSLL
jgi:hypothetical protein